MLTYASLRSTWFLFLASTSSCLGLLPLLPETISSTDQSQAKNNVLILLTLLFLQLHFFRFRKLSYKLAGLLAYSLGTIMELILKICNLSLCNKTLNITILFRIPPPPVPEMLSKFNPTPSIGLQRLFKWSKKIHNVFM